MVWLIVHHKCISSSICFSLHSERGVWRHIAQPELPHILQIALVLWGNLYEAIGVVWPNICKIHSFMLGQSGGRKKCKKDGMTIAIIQIQKVRGEILADHK